MKTSSDSKSGKSVSTPKKIALAVLGVLSLLTLANIIEASIHKFKDSYHGEEEIAIHIDEDIAVHIDEDIYLHDDNHVVVHVDRNNQVSVASGELMIEESFKVSPGENLLVSVNDADVNVETNNGSEALVKVYLDGRDMDKAREYFEDQNFEVTREGVNVYVKTYPKRKSSSWNRNGGANIQVEVTVPYEFNVSVKTSDGDISMDKAEGETMLQSSDGDIAAAELVGSSVNIRTSDGDVSTEAIEASRVSIATSDGDIAIEDITSDDATIRTSDGDIKADALSGSMSVSTSDGDIVIKTLTGSRVSVRTSDGEIIANQVDANSSDFQTSDGSILLKDVSGDLKAITSSGDLNVHLTEAGEVYLRTGDGDIHIKAPQDYSAELSLKGERVRLSSGFQFDGKLKENAAEGRINGGGQSLEARTSDGEVVFREN